MPTALPITCSRLTTARSWRSRLRKEGAMPASSSLKNSGFRVPTADTVHAAGHARLPDGQNVDGVLRGRQRERIFDEVPKAAHGTHVDADHVGAFSASRRRVGPATGPRSSGGRLAGEVSGVGVRRIERRLHCRAEPRPQHIERFHGGKLHRLRRQQVCYKGLLTCWCRPSMPARRRSESAQASINSWCTVGVLG